MNDFRQYMQSEDAERVDQLLAGPWSDVWSRVQELWRKADAVYVGMIGPAVDFHVQPEFAVALEICGRHPEAPKALFSALHDPSPLVAAYSLLALRERPSWSKEELQDSVLGRSEPVHWHAGCFRWQQTLGEGLAQLVEERPSEEHPWERAKEEERRWAGKERSCPKCGTKFISVQNLGVCPGCRHQFRASNAGGHP